MKDNSPISKGSTLVIPKLLLRNKIAQETNIYSLYNVQNLKKDKRKKKQQGYTFVYCAYVFYLYIQSLKLANFRGVVDVNIYILPLLSYPLPLPLNPPPPPLFLNKPGPEIIKISCSTQLTMKD